MIHRIKTWFGRLARAVFVRPRHRFSWVVGGAVALAMVIIVVPGAPLMPRGSNAYPNRESVFSRADGKPLNVVEFVHGWPWAFLQRGDGWGGEGWPDRPPRVTPRLSYPAAWLGQNSSMRVLRYGHPSGGVVWTSSYAWAATGLAVEFRFLALIADLATAAAIVFAALQLTERWVRSHNRWFQLRLFDLLLLATGVAVPLGWWQHHQQQAAIENELWRHYLADASWKYNTGVTEEMEKQSVWRANRRNFTPSWLRRLLGTGGLTTWCERLARVDLNASWTSPEVADLVRRLRYADVSLTVSGSAEELDRLGEGKNIRVVRFTGPLSRKSDRASLSTREALAELSKLPDLEALHFGSPPHLIDRYRYRDRSDQEKRINEMKGQALAVARYGRVTPGVLTPLLTSPSLQELHVQAMTELEAQAFAETHAPRFTLSPVGGSYLTPWAEAWAIVRDWRIAAGDDMTTGSSVPGHLWLNGVQLSQEQIEVLSPFATELTALGLGREGLRPGVPRLIKRCPNLEEISFGFRTVSPIEMAGSIWRSTWGHCELKKIDIKCSLDHETLTRLAAMPSIEELTIAFKRSRASLSDLSVYDHCKLDLSPLASLPHLKRLKLTCGAILVEDLEPLLESPSLESLELGFCCVTPDELAAFEDRVRPRFTIKAYKNHHRNAWNAARCRLERWSNGGAIGRYEAYPVIDLYLGDTKLTPTQLATLQPYAIQLRELGLGASGDTATAREVLKAALNLRRLDLGNRRATVDEVSECIERQRMSNITLEQGDLQSQDFIELARGAKKKAWLTVLNCTYKDRSKELTKIMREFDKSVLSANWYRGLEVVPKHRLHGDWR
ncbi:MAG: hypothetical protein AAGI53_17725 [Planctomycetota bacterium]